MTFSRLQFLLLALACTTPGLLACDGCQEKKQTPALTLPFFDSFDRPTLGKQWRTERPGRWKIDYNPSTQKGRLCGEQARTNHIFLRSRLPDDVEIELDVWGLDRDGDIKMEIFSDGRYNKTGYVLIQGGWVNKLSIIDRLDEHNNKTRSVRSPKQGKPLVVRNQKYHWRVVRYGQKVTWYVDGKLYLKYDDPLPLRNPNHAYLAFGNWIAKTCFDNLSIKRYQPPAPARTTATPANTNPEPSPTPAPIPPTPQVQPAPAPARVPTPQAAPRLQLAVPRKRPLLLHPLQPLHKPMQIHMINPKLQSRHVRYLIPQRIPARRP